MLHRIRLVVFLFLPFIILSFAGPCTISAQTVQKKTSVTGKKHHAAIHRYSHRKKHKKIHKDSLAHAPQVIQRHYPVPGAGGEDRNFDWWIKRAYPNGSIDPEYYPNALAAARKLPTWEPHYKNSTQSAMQWQQIGPYTIGGRVTAIVTHPTDSNTFYVGAAAGGLWKTTDHGNSWQALTDTFAQLPIGCVTLDPHDPNTIYIGMGECNGSGDSYPGNGVWRSTDAGQTWTSLGLVKTQYIATIIIDPTDKNTIYVCAPGTQALSSPSDSNRGIYKSTDYGVSWVRSFFLRAGTAKASTPVPTIDLVMNPADHNDLVTATWQQFTFSVSSSPYTGLWRSRDGGGTWNRIDTIKGSGCPNGLALKRLSRIALLWVNNSKGVPTLFSSICKFDKNPLTGTSFDAENLYGIYRTTDPESGWQKVLDSNFRIPFGGVVFSSYIDSIDFFNKQGGYDNFLAVNPAHPDEIYAGGIDIIRSIDGGSTWKDVSNGYTHYFNNDRSQHSDQHALAFTASLSGNDLLDGQDGGVFNTRDFGASWTQLKGLPITMFYHLEPWDAGMANLPNNFPADSIKLMGGTQDNGTVAHGFTNNSDWDWINKGDGGQSQADPNNAGHLITSLQLGRTFFRSFADSLKPISQNDVANHDPSAKVWTDLSIIAARRGVTDSSESAAFIAPVVLDKVRGNELYIGKLHVYHVKLDYVNRDTGTVIKLWSPQLGGNGKAWYNGTIDCIGLGSRDGNGRPMLWAGGLLNNSTSLFRTVYNPTIPQDSAPRWISAAGGLPAAYVEALACDRSDSMTAYCGLTGTSSSSHVYKTINGGKNWKSISGNLPNIGINAIIIDSLAEHGDPAAKNQCLIVATDVGVFVTTDGGKTWANLGSGMPHLVVGTINMYKNWLVAGTHGRSAWALDVSSLQAVPVNAVQASGETTNNFSITSIYPSPLRSHSSQTIHIQLNQTVNKTLNIELMNAATGASVFRATIEPQGEKIDLQIPSWVASGSYLIRIVKADGKFCTREIIILK